MDATAAPLRWGILSTANINTKFLAGIRAAPGNEVVAVASRDGARARQYAHEREIPRAHAGYEQMLEDPDVEAVYIPLPNSMHVPWTLRALEAGKHVLCEKPLTRHVADAERAFALAEERGLCLSEAFMYRHHLQTHRMQELVESGRVGELRAVRSHFSFNSRNAADVRLSAELDGGALMDVGCYCVSASRLLAGEPERFAAVQLTGGDGVDVRFAGVLGFPGGVLAHFDCGLDLANRFELEVVGAEGTLFLADPWHANEPVIEVRDERGSERIEIEPANPYGLQAANFAAAVRGHGELLLGARDGLAQARAIEALYAAAASA